MDPDLRPKLPDAGADLEHLQPDRIELRPGPGGVAEMMPPQGVFQDVGHRVQKQAELIGLEPMAGGPVGAKMGLMVLDEKLHRAPLAVELLVDDPRGQGREIRHHETRVRSEGVMLGFDDDPGLFGPALGSIGELAEVADRISLLPEAPRGGFDQGGGPLAQDRIRRQPQEEAQILGPAKIKDLGGCVVRIGPEEDAHLGPGFANLSDDPLKDRHDLLSRGPSPRPQDRGDQLPTPSLIDVDRQITELVVVGVEESHLLMPVGRVGGVVDVEEDGDRRRPVGGDERDEKRHIAAFADLRHDKINRSHSGIHSPGPPAGKVGRAFLRVLPLGRPNLGFRLDPHHLRHHPLEHGQEGIRFRDEL